MNSLYLGLLIVAFLVVELLIGGTRLVFSLPAYGFLALAAVLSAASFRRTQVPPNLLCLMASVLFFGYVLIRIGFSPVEYVARPDLFMVLGALMVYLLTAFYLTLPKHRIIFVLAMLGLGLGQVLMGAIQYFTGKRAVLFSFLQPADFGVRATGLFICPNHLAGFLEVTVLLGLSLACWSRRPLWLKLVAGYAALVGLLGLLLTGSRGGYLSMLFGLIVFAGLSLMAIGHARPGRRFIAVTGGLLLAGLVGAGITYVISREPAIQSRSFKMLDQNDIRIDLWQAAIRQFGVNPLVGTGSGTYLYYGRQFRAPRVVADPVYAHNDYLQFLAEFGLIGAVMFGVFFLGHLWSGWKAFHWFVTERGSALGRIQSDALALTIGALSVLAAYSVHSIFDFNLHIPGNALLLAFVFGLIAQPGVAFPFREGQFPELSRYLRLSLPALGLWVALAALPSLPAEYFAEKARQALRDERYQEAIAFAQQGIERDKTNPHLFLYLGQAHTSLAESIEEPSARTNAWTAALAPLRHGLQLFPQDQWLLLETGLALDALGHFDEAEPVFQNAIFWDPNSAVVRLHYASHLRQSGKLTQAEREYKNSLALFPHEAARIGLEALVRDRQTRDAERLER